jgi:hypothetical protein
MAELVVSAPRRIHSNLFHKALVDAGVIRADEFYRRIVIDAQEGEAVKIYAERYADDRLLSVVMTLDGTEVHYGQQTPAPGTD